MKQSSRASALSCNECPAVHSGMSRFADVGDTVAAPQAGRELTRRGRDAM
jgi:hypothetical protein